MLADSINHFFSQSVTHTRLQSLQIVRLICLKRHLLLCKLYQPVFFCLSLECCNTCYKQKTMASKLTSEEVKTSCWKMHYVTALFYKCKFQSNIFQFHVMYFLLSTTQNCNYYSDSGDECNNVSIAIFDL